MTLTGLCKKNEETFYLLMKFELYSFTLKVMRNPIFLQLVLTLLPQLCKQRPPTSAGRLWRFASALSVSSLLCDRAVGELITHLRMIILLELMLWYSGAYKQSLFKVFNHVHHLEPNRN